MSDARPFADLTVEKLTKDLRELGYIADRGLATSILISLESLASHFYLKVRLA